MFSNLFKKSSFGLHVGEGSLKFTELIKTKNGLCVGEHGEINIPTEVIQSGKIQDKKKFEEILKSLRKDFGLESAYVSLPNEFWQFVQDYKEAFKNSKISIKSLESEVEALARSVLKTGDTDTCLIVHFNKSYSTIFVISEGVLSYYALASNAIYFLREELSKHFLNWHKHENEKNKMPITKIILCGEEPNLAEFSEYLSTYLRNKVEVANVWVNILDTGKYVPEINFERSTGFAVALGLALKDF